MKLDRTYLFIAVSSVALLTVLIIQINWILETAQIKEEIFNEKANMVLSKTAQALAYDTVTVKKIEVCVGRNETHKIDSLFNYYMKLYKIKIGYYFEVKQFSLPSQYKSIYAEKQGCYQTCVTDASSRSATIGADRNAVGLKLVFPDKEEFIMAEMGIPFISSVILIVVVLVMSWRTILSLMKEKEISQHTTDFLNNMTHEFKTPLTNIALAGKMMVKESNIKKEEKIRHYSGIILEENEKLRLQVEQVLSMTALERGEIPLRKTELDAHELIHDALKCISVQIENTQGHVTVNLNAARFMILGDKTHLTNAICNVVDNAIKYSGESPELSVQTTNAGQNLILKITDNGIGIDEEYHKKVFDKFFRVPTGNVHDVKGFGLGLTYIKTIIELHGGTIELDSERGRGTTFTITLPNV